MNLSIFHQYINLTLFAILGNIRSSSSAALAPGNSVSFYNASDKITVLNSDNFLSTVYQSNTAWLIEFYASWCGHCQHYAKIYKEVGIDTWAWRTVVRIGAINCHSGDNIGLCRQHKVRGFPTLQLIPPDAIFDNKSSPIILPATDAVGVEKELIKGLENLNRRNTTWPRFIPVNRLTLEEIYISLPKSIKLLLIIAEKRDDFTGRQIMLDFSKYQNQIAIFRTTTDGKFWRRFHLNITDVPALFVILRNRTAQRLDARQILANTTGNRNRFNYFIRSYIHQTKSIENFDNEDIKEIIQSKKAQSNNNLTDDVREKNTVYRKIHIVDLELALSYMLRNEIPQMEHIQGEAYDALSQWLTVLVKYFPGRPPVMAYLEYVLSKVNDHSKGLNGDLFRQIVDMKTSKAYLPSDHKEYQHCAGSAPQYRGYPCALWLIFHTLTVSQYERALSNAGSIEVTEVLSAIKNYVKHFFACRECSKNFMKETADINRLNSTNQYEAILYLWKVHNHVNQRLHNDVSEDPKYPKVQFPSKYLCQTCQLNPNEYDHSKTIEFLLQYYSKGNIDQSVLGKKFFDLFVDRPERFISKIDRPGISTHIFEHFFVYILLGVLIVLLLIRRRCCQTKGRRYRL